MSKKDRGHAQAAKDHENEAGRDAGLDQAAAGQERGDGITDDQTGAGKSLSADQPDTGLDQRNEALSDGKGSVEAGTVAAGGGKAAAQSAKFAGQVVDVASGNMVGIGDDNISEAGADIGKPVVDTPDYLLEAMGEEVQTPLYDAFNVYKARTGELMRSLCIIGEATRAFDELFGFYRDNPTAPDAAGLIHIKRKLRIDIDQSDPLFPIALSSMRTLVVGVLAHDAAVKKAAADAEKPPQDRAPMHGETALTVDDQPFAANGLSPSL